MKVYLSGPMTGYDHKTMSEWREEATKAFAKSGIECLSPVRHMDHVNIMCDKFAYHRDKFDVQRCDVLLVYLIGATRISIGTMFELAWAEMWNKPVVTVIEPFGSLHEHLFVKEASSILVKNMDEGIKHTLSILLSSEEDFLNGLKK